MDEPIETMLVEVRASTQGFRSDVEAMRGTFDRSLVDGFAQAGNVLERGLLSAMRRGSLGFEDLKRTAVQTLNRIAAHAVGCHRQSGGGTDIQRHPAGDLTSGPKGRL